MKIAVIGTGYVGLVTGVGFAEHSNLVTCVDADPDVVVRLKQGKPHFHENGLQDALKHCVSTGNLQFTSSIKDGIKDAEVIFLALPTPEGADGSADLSIILNVAKKLGPLLQSYVVIVNKSTVPVGTTEMVKAEVSKHAKINFDVVSNPEFLAEGNAVHDVRHPSRIVVGTTSERARKVMAELYKPYVRNGNPIRYMSEASAELTKYAANGFLATKISFINSIASLAQRIPGADINDIRLAIGDDPRIGNKFTYPGPGWGGSCFPKDSRALIQIAEDYDFDFGIMKAADEENDKKLGELSENVINYFNGDIKNKKIALWGLSFKKETDDIRESPAIITLEKLLSAGSRIVAYDPAGMKKTESKIGKQESLSYADNQFDAIDGADALVIATEWDVFSLSDSENVKRMKKLMKKPVIFDARNLLDIDMMRTNGFYYQANGRPIVQPKTK